MEIKAINALGTYIDIAQIIITIKSLPYIIFFLEVEKVVLTSISTMLYWAYNKS